MRSNQGVTNDQLTMNWGQTITHYKTDERTIKNITYNNVECTEKNDSLQFISYNRSNTIKKLETKNNQGIPTPLLKRTNVINQNTCPHGDCEHRTSIYIGMTTTTISSRLTMHLASGAPKQHALVDYHQQLTWTDQQDKSNISCLNP